MAKKTKKVRTTKTSKPSKTTRGKKTPRTKRRKAAKSVKRVAKRAASTVIETASDKIHRAAVQARDRVEKSKKKTAATPATPAPVKTSAAPKRRPAASTTPPRRVVRTSSPVPDPDVITPKQTSSHGPFDKRSARDPDRIKGGEKLLNEQFAEEDHFTNRTGSPRIGTRGRKYTP